MGKDYPCARHVCTRGIRMGNKERREDRFHAKKAEKAWKEAKRMRKALEKKTEERYKYFLDNR